MPEVREMPISDYVRFSITVAIPQSPDDLTEVIDAINRENGLDDSGPSFLSFIDADCVDETNPQGFDVTEFATFVLNNRDVSETANNLVSHFDYETY